MRRPDGRQLRVASLLLWPFAPTETEELWRRLGSHYVDAVVNNRIGELADCAGVRPQAFHEAGWQFRDDETSERVQQAKQGSPIAWVTAG